MQRTLEEPGARYWWATDLRARVARTESSSQGANVKELRCRDVGFDCEAVVHGETVDEVMAQAGPHAKEAHGVNVTPELAGQIKTLVHDA